MASKKQAILKQRTAATSSKINLHSPYADVASKCNEQATVMETLHTMSPTTASNITPEEADQSKDNETRIFSKCTIVTKARLDPGLFGIRHLAGDQYEIVNIEDLNSDLLSSEQARKELQEDPDRGDLLELPEHLWEAVQENCKLAARISSRDIFPIENLPPELIKDICDLVVTFDKPIIKQVHPKSVNARPRPHHILLPLDLMFTSRRFYEECKSAFWGNNIFVHANHSLKWLNTHKDYTEHVTCLTFVWEGLVRDRESFFDIRTLPQLKELVISLSRKHRQINSLQVLPVMDMEKIHNHVNRNKLYQNDEREAIKRFSQAHGFDNLVQIRGLRKISLSIDRNLYWSVGERPCELVQAFEAFLRKILTLPKDASVTAVKPRVARKPRKPSPSTFRIKELADDEVDGF